MPILMSGTGKGSKGKAEAGRDRDHYLSWVVRECSGLQDKPPQIEVLQTTIFALSPEMLWTDWAQLGGSSVHPRFLLGVLSSEASPSGNIQDDSLTCLVSPQGWQEGWAPLGCQHSRAQSPGSLRAFPCLGGLSRWPFHLALLVE